MQRETAVDGEIRTDSKVLSQSLMKDHCNSTSHSLIATLREIVKLKVK